LAATYRRRLPIVGGCVGRLGKPSLFVVELTGTSWSLKVCRRRFGRVRTGYSLGIGLSNDRVMPRRAARVLGRHTEGADSWAGFALHFLIASCERYQIDSVLLVMLGRSRDEDVR
jgi:hypothetical protein